MLPSFGTIWEKSEQFSARTSSLNHKSIRFSQFPLPVPCKRSSAVPIPFGVGFQFLGHAVSLRQLRHDQLHAVSCRFVNLSAILSYVHPAIRPGGFYIGRKLSKRKPRSQRNEVFGGDKRDRTADLLNAIQALSQLSYTPRCLRPSCDCLIIIARNTWCVNRKIQKIR